MIKLTTYELRLIAGKRGIKNYQNMSREKSLSTLDKSERITKNLLKNELKRIARMQNLSLNELEQIKIYRKINLSKLQKIDALKTTKIRRRKIY